LILVTGNVAELARSDVRVLNPLDPSGPLTPRPQQMIHV
jgi:hypothetical protein